MLEDLAGRGVVGVRFNLVSYDRDALVRPDAPKLLARIKALGWFAQVYADDAQWQAAAPVLRASNVNVIVDHLGVRGLARGIGQRGFQEVLSLGSDGRAIVKLSGLYRISAAAKPNSPTSIRSSSGWLLRSASTDACGARIGPSSTRA